jgi:GNAT superfamily N-acetyltransferase
MLSIRPATVQDIPMIRELTYRIWPQTYAPILSEEQIAYMLGKMYNPETLTAQMAEPTHQFVLCYDDAQAVAFAAYSEIEENAYKLHKIYVLPGQQGKGVGRYIIDYIAGDIITKGVAILYLNVNRYNYPALSFYEKTGFTLFKEEDIDIGNGYFMNDYVLRLHVEKQ